MKWERWVADIRTVTVFREYERVDILLRALPRRPLPTDEQLHAALSRASVPRITPQQSRPSLFKFLSQMRDTVSAMVLSRVTIAIASAAKIEGIVIFGLFVFF